MAARGARFPTPEPGAGHSQSPEASAGNRGRFLVRFGSDFSLSGVLALNNVSRNNSSGRQQYRVIGKGFMALRVKLNWHPDVNFLDGIFLPGKGVRFILITAAATWSSSPATMPACRGTVWPAGPGGCGWGHCRAL